MSEYKIIVVDDETDILDLYESLLTELGDVVIFSNPEEAIPYIEKEAGNISCIISDFSMPQLNGLQLREKIYSFSTDIPFLIVTGFYTKEMAAEALALKVSAFIEKPFEVESLISVVSKNIDERVTAINDDKEMIMSFIEESSQMLDDIQDLILDLESSPGDKNILNTYFRFLHTIKGTAACVGLESIARFVHKYEDLVGSMKEGEVVVSKAVIDVLLKGYDYVKQMYASIITHGKNVVDVDNALIIFDVDFSKEVEITSTENESASTDQVETALSPSNNNEKEDEKLNVSISILDNFMELSGELTVLKNTIVKSTSKIEAKYRGDKDVEILSDFIAEMQKVSAKLQGQVSEMRKVSIESIFKPMKRVVRDACKTLGKKIDLRTSGESIMVDTSLGRLLSNVLIHLTRNSVDHGVEKPAARVEKGKLEEGRIDLICMDEGENIIIDIIDDGNGINAEVLKKKALEKGLYTEDEIFHMSNKRIFEFIFESGFSTAEVVTDISGRGVGMDMVRSSILKIGGSISIDSILSQGSTFRLTLPKPRSIVIIKSLLVEIENLFFALPLDDVNEVVLIERSIDQGKIQDIEGGLVLKHYDELIPLINLNDILNISKNGIEKGSLYQIVVINLNGLKYGIIVDVIHDIEEVVIKKLSKLIGSDSYYLGTTFIGDGDLAMILDLENLALKQNFEMNDLASSDIHVTNNNVVEKFEILQFNLNLSSIFSVPLHYVFRLEVVGKDQINFSGDLPILRYRESFLPLLFLENIMSDKSVTIDEIMQTMDDFNIIVVHEGGKKIGLVVNEIQDIISTAANISTKNINKIEIYGTLYHEEELVNVLNIDYLLNQYKKYYSKKTYKVDSVA